MWIEHDVVAVQFKAMLIIDHHLLHAQQTPNEYLVNQTKTFVHLTEHTHKGFSPTQHLWLLFSSFLFCGSLPTRRPRFALNSVSDCLSVPCAIVTPRSSAVAEIPREHDVLSCEINIMDRSRRRPKFDVLFNNYVCKFNQRWLTCVNCAVRHFIFYT